MKFLILSSLFISSLALSQQGGVFQYLKLLPTTIPTYCGVGDLRTNNSTDTLNICTAANTWSQFQGLLTWTAPLSDVGGTVSIPKATSTQNGYLGSTDWTTFNGKQSPITFGTTTESTSDVLTLGSWSNATQGSPTIQVKKATSTQDGYLASTDWTTFNGKQSTISVTAPIGLSGAVISANVPWAITASTSTTTGEIIKGASGQSNDLVDWENSTGTVLSEVNSAGKVGVGTTSPNAMVQVNAASSTTVGEIVQGASSQSSDLVDWENSTGTKLVSIGSGGVLTLGTALATSSGGTGTASAGTQYGVVYYSTTTGMASTAAGSSGNVLTSNGTSAPTFQAAGSSPTNSYASSYFDTTATWSTTSTTYADPTNATSDTLHSRFSSGITLTAGGSSVLGVTFTPAASTSVYWVKASVNLTLTSAGAFVALKLTDGTNVIDTAVGNGVSANQGINITLQGPYPPGTASAVTIKVQLAVSAGTAEFFDFSTGLSTPASFSVIQIK